jgi:hypothetical protein
MSLDHFEQRSGHSKRRSERQWEKEFRRTLDYYEDVLKKLKTRHELGSSATRPETLHDIHDTALLVFKQETLKHNMHLLVPQFADFFRLREITATHDNQEYAKLLVDIISHLPEALDKAEEKDVAFGKTQFSDMEEELVAVCEWGKRWQFVSGRNNMDIANNMENLLREEYPLTSAMFSQPMPPCADPSSYSVITKGALVFVCVWVLCIALEHCFRGILLDRPSEPPERKS